MRRRVLLDADRGEPLRLEMVSLDAGALAELGAMPIDQPARPVWCQLGMAGEYRGHADGGFELTPQVFAQIIENFHRNPKYSLGQTDVVPIDYHHLSETLPGTVAERGAPAQGWILELQMRAGGQELWGLVRWLEPARTQVIERKYQGLSMTIWPNALDPRSGKRIGWILSSVALTNDPFIQGMSPPVAAHRAADAARAKCAADLAKATGAEAQTAEPTIGEGEIIMKMLGRIARRLGVAAQVITAAEAAPTSAPEVSALEFEIERGVERRALELKGLREGITKMGELLKLDMGEPGAPMDLDAMCAKLQMAVQAATAFAAMGPEIEAMRMSKAATEAKAVEDEVDQVMASRKYDVAMRPALLSMRNTDAAAFAAAYPAPPNTHKHLLQAIVTSPKGQAIVADAHGGHIQRTTAQLAPPPLGTEPKMLTRGEGPPAFGDLTSEAQLAAFPGRNAVEKAMAYIATSGVKLDHAEATKQGTELVRRLRLAARENAA